MRRNVTISVIQDRKNPLKGNVLVELYLNVMRKVG
jgi:hypothetical protein